LRRVSIFRDKAGAGENGAAGVLGVAGILLGALAMKEDAAAIVDDTASELAEGA
jgi:hypothetical protein